MGPARGRQLRCYEPSGRLPTRLTCRFSQAVKVELVINVNTAKALGITFPLPLLGRADEAIE